MRGYFQSDEKRRALRALLALLAGLVLSFEVSAQILNIEKKRMERPEDEYVTGNAGVSFNYNNRSPTLQEPVRVMNTGVTSNIGYFSDPNAYLLINDYQLLRINGSSIVDTGVSHLRVQFQRPRLINYEAYVQYQYDRPRGLTFRGLAGAGARLRILHTEAINLTTGLGAMYERERWLHPTDDTVVRAEFIKLNSYLSSRVEVSETADFNGVVYYQVGRDETQGVYRQRMTAELNLGVKITETLALTSSFQGAYETRPLVPILRFIYATHHGVRVNF
jgi:hypothetical protein